MAAALGGEGGEYLAHRSRRAGGHQVEGPGAFLEIGAPPAEGPVQLDAGGGQDILSASARRRGERRFERQDGAGEAREVGERVALDRIDAMTGRRIGRRGADGGEV